MNPILFAQFLPESVRHDCKWVECVAPKRVPGKLVADNNRSDIVDRLHTTVAVQYELTVDVEDDEAYEAADELVVDSKRRRRRLVVAAGVAVRLHKIHDAVAVDVREPLDNSPLSAAFVVVADNHNLVDVAALVHTRRPFVAVEPRNKLPAYRPNVDVVVDVAVAFH